MSKIMGILEAATVTSKGQVTIPKRVRERLQIEAGDRLEFVVTEEGELTVRRERDAMERLRDVRETLAPLEVDVDDLRRRAKTAWSSVDAG
jgi:AbrB family looped-hinge helix DNA binding protein